MTCDHKTFNVVQTEWGMTPKFQETCLCGQVVRVINGIKWRQHIETSELNAIKAISGKSIDFVGRSDYAWRY